MRQILVPALGQLCKDKQKRQQELSPTWPADATCSLAGLYTQSTRVKPELDVLLMRKESLNIKPMQMNFFFLIKISSDT